MAVASFARVLRPGGYLLVGSALGGEYFSPDSIKALLASEFEIVERAANIGKSGRCVRPRRTVSVS